MFKRFIKTFKSGYKLDKSWMNFPNSEKEREMSKNKKIVTGAVAAIVVLALAGGIWWYIDERPKTPDITDQEADQALQYLIAALGGMDIYLHVSGIGKQNKTLDPEIEENTFQTNVVGFGRMVGAVYRYFSQKGKGQIAVVSSIAGTKGLGVAPAYSATKRFQNTYIQALAQLTRMEGCHIDFTDIRPGFVDTALLSGTQHYPMLMRPEKVARQIVSAIEHRRRVVVIDWRYAVITYIWQLIPRWVWERMVVRTRRK